MPQLRRVGSLESLRAEATAKSVTAPAEERRQQCDSSAYVVEDYGQQWRRCRGVAAKGIVALLRGSELAQPVVVEARLAPGTYNVKYRVDFQDGNRPTEGITELAKQRTPDGPANLQLTQALVRINNVVCSAFLKS